ncbi:hypothetical protein Tco_1375670 [Tanacetum coccineum]
MKSTIQKLNQVDRGFPFDLFHVGSGLANVILTIVKEVKLKKNVVKVKEKSSNCRQTAETTPVKKKRMTKLRIIAGENVVSQSPIKAINLGDKSGKASNRISNTPKDAQLNGFLMNITVSDHQIV